MEPYNTKLRAGETMDERQIQSSKRRWSLSAAVVALVITVFTVAFYWRTFSKSEEITLCDVSFFADEGLVSLSLPLTRLSREGTCFSRLRVFNRSERGWSSESTLRRPLRKQIEQMQARGRPTTDPFGRSGSGVGTDNKRPRDFFALAGFGYNSGDWLSEDRPGPWIKIFVPVWFVGLGCYLIYLGLRWRRVRFGIRTLIGLMLVVALFLWATHARVPEALPRLGTFIWHR